MGFTKYQSVEKTQVLSPKQHKAVEKELHKTGHTAVSQLPQKDRDKVTK